MGYKRPLEADGFEDFPFNPAKRFEYNNDLVSFVDVDTPNKASLRPVISAEDEGGFYNIRQYDALETDTVTEAPRNGEKDSGPFSGISSEDDGGSWSTPLSSVSSDYLEFNSPQRSFFPMDDGYLALDRSPRKPVPVGPNHQAIIPFWRVEVKKKSGFTETDNFDRSSSGPGSENVGYEIEEKLMGTPLISMPNLSFHPCKSDKIGEGRTLCNCVDRGSIRCVQHHVKEARENLRMTFGHENFVNLGFLDMGEEVALKWSEEEEDVFHEVVYSNPASLGRNFWKQLSATFPSRTQKEIVSYYFNVFMLRRRAAQNRSRLLDIDSDDDECHKSNPGFYGFHVSEEDSAIESVDDQDDHRGNQDNYSEEDDGDDDNSDDDTNCNDIVSAGYDMGNTTEEESGFGQISVACQVNSQKESWSGSNQHVDGTPGTAKEDFGFQDDSCMSFDYQTNMVECNPIDANAAFQASGFKCDQSARMTGKLDLSNDVYLLDPCDTKDWYPDYSTGSATNVEFLPTSNLIEEFFGQAAPDKKTRHD
ncbi:hypothetical protein L6164_027030 [Bauhinia variegata]|uniref:Uncharacterized protein n=1 Tax=Bauhinia variegata TaxID=167791 RepID=A0ACB9LTE4_BAUVA|nr:hypothetical protein L6164_027030 [Bauhinia variegata]